MHAPLMVAMELSAPVAILRAWQTDVDSTRLYLPGYTLLTNRG